MPNRVVIDARKLEDGGIGVYIQNLVDALIGLNLNAKISLIIAKNENSKIKERWQNKVEFIQDSAGKYSLAEYFLMPLRLRSVFKDSLIHFPHYTVPFFLPHSAKVIVTVHDCIHLKSHNIFKRIFSKLMIAWAIKCADRLITVSNYSKAIILKNFSITSDKIDVIANCIAPALEIQVKKQESDYFLFVGNGREHKGLDLLLKASEKFDRKLLIVGSSFTPEQKDQATDSIIFVEQCSARELSNLYAGASALIMPSYEEGFGIPVLEALSFGVPVVAMPVASLIEWFGDTVWYADRFDAESLLQTINSMLLNSELREQKVALGLVLSKKFSLSRFAEETLQSYKKLLPVLRSDDNKVLSKVA